MKNIPTLAAALLAAAALPLAAQTTQLNPPADRISDQAIAADQQAYEQLQGRIKGLNDRGRPVADYFLSKAQCWLDVSFHEYTRNDRSAFPQEAMTEAEKLIVGMERGDQNLPLDTALVNGAAKLRQDLWDRAALLKQDRGLKCAAQALACAEVELVHAGNEYNQQQWRHAKPYIQIAEDLFQRASEQAKACPEDKPPVKPEPPVVPPPVTPPPQLPPVQVTEALLSVNVVFNFDKHTVKDIRPFSIVQLEQLVERVKNMDVRSVRLVGHADRLNSTGVKTYNDTLSEKRVQTVRNEMIRLGIDPKLITTDARGDTQQIEGCEARFKSQTDLRECLLPNRRVEVQIDARKK